MHDVLDFTLSINCGVIGCYIIIILTLDNNNNRYDKTEKWNNRWNNQLKLMCFH